MTQTTLRNNGLKWSWRRELNPRPSDYKSDALPTELRQRLFILDEFADPSHLRDIHSRTARHRDCGRPTPAKIF